MNAWLLLAVVVGVLAAFWFWLARLFDAITEMHAAARRREDAEATRERGAS